MISPSAKQSLEMLVATTLELIERGCNNGSFAPYQQAYFRWRLEGDPKFSEKGVELPSARGETLVRPSWAMAKALVTQREVPQTREFQAAVGDLRGLAEIGTHADQYLQSFVFALAGKAFELRPHAPQAAFEGLVRRFLDDIEGRPFECGAEVELEGLVLESEKVEPTSAVLLRRPKREDFEEETPYYGPGPSPELSFLRTMSAVAMIRRKGTGPQDAQRAVEKLVALLRLFEVASVRYLSYQLFGESIINPMAARLSSGAREVVHERALIRSRDEARLQRFWCALEPMMPDTFYEVSTTDWDYRDVAYERYSAALMKPVSFEERVASAVMALEALFLEDRLELAYRLGLRVAKLVSFLGERPVAVRDVLRDAYRVRSTFAHGARLSSGRRRELDGRYQNTGGLVRQILNFVRKAIIATLLVRRTKEDLISLIDEALIEHSREDELRQLLLPVLELI